MSKYQALKEAPSLHDQIMNIEAKPAKVNGINYVLTYKEGHRDARHAAAELAASQDATISALLADLEAAEKRLIWLIGQHWVEPEAVFRLNLSGTDDAAAYEQEAIAAIDAALAQMAKGE